MKRVAQVLTRSFALSTFVFHGGHSGYDLVNERMLRNFVPSDPHETMDKALRILVGEEDAEILSRIPVTGITVAKFAKKLGFTLEDMHDKVTQLAERGMVFDFELKGERCIWFPDFIIGWFELVEMKDRTGEIPVKEMADLFSEYINEVALSAMHADHEVMEMRTFVREETVDTDVVHFLDHESIERTIQDSYLVCMGNCACRKIKVEQGILPEDTDLEVCLSFDGFAEPMLKYDVVWEITKEEALQMIEEQKALGLPQTGDNTKQCYWICNCDHEHCIILGGKIRHGYDKVIMPSNFICELENEDDCVGCAMCVDKCPIRCLSLDSNNKVSLLSEDCLGCGVCATICPSDVFTMVRREEEIPVPEDFLEKYLRTAFNRNGLHNVIFPDLDKNTHRIGRQVFKLIEESGLLKNMLMTKGLKSTFLKLLFKTAKKLDKIPF